MGQMISEVNDAIEDCLVYVGDYANLKPRARFYFSMF
jgi:hypothetical protein